LTHKQERTKYGTA